MLHSLDHVIVAVRDLDLATRCQAILLGRAPSWRGEHPGAGTRNTLFRLSNTTIELLAPHGAGPIGAQIEAWLAARGEGLLGLAFGTEDAQACRDELARRGLAPGAIEKGLGRDVESGAFREWLRVPLPLEATRGVPIFAIERRSPEELLPLASPLASEPACVNALDHTVIRSANPDAVRKLYGDGLGLRLALDREFPAWGARLMFFRVGGLTIEIAASLEGADASELASGDRPYGLSYRVGSADAARERLAQAGVDVSEVRDGRRPGTRVFSVRSGSCGVPTLMLEPPSVDAEAGG